ncbi:MAG: O-antigen ligase family protein [Cyanobacteria bacterium P01_D01_bin.105]
MSSAEGKDVRNEWKNSPEEKPEQRSQRLWLISLVILPYVSYAGLLVMVLPYVAALRKRGKCVWQCCGRYGFGWLTAGLLLSAGFAINRGEAFLQLTNFLPFFLFFGVLSTVPSVVKQPFLKLEQLARWLLLTSVPMSVLAICEFIIKFGSVAPIVKAWPLPPWLLSFIYVPDFGHRAHSIFSHPNGLAAYSVIIFGLGLGLVLKGLEEDALLKRSPQIGALVLCGAAIFCTGSRNGVLIALMLTAITMYAARRYRWITFAGLIGGGAIVAAVLSLGIGGRSLSFAMLSNDPRVSVWTLAIEMIQQRPWLGWGFAGLRTLYIPGSIPDYENINHAHNLWLMLASEAGIPVMVAFSVIIGTIYFQGVYAYLEGKLTGQKRAIFLGYLLAFAACILFNVFDIALFDARINVLAWGALTAVHVLSEAVLNQAPVSKASVR